MKRLADFFYRADKIFSSRQFDALAQIIFKLRFALGAIIFLLCIILELHGSSISFYAQILQHPELDINILGEFRPIRSDEYVVFTPFAFSQYFTNFSMISDVIRGTATNVFMTYGQAVWHPAQIFRPAQIGYLFLDQGSGLAFFWMGRLIVLFLVSFEFARKILNAKNNLSLLYAVMIAFSPLAQWWWSVNSIAEILTAGQGLVLFWKLYLQETAPKRFLYAAGFLYCAGIFVFALYPGWQVSFGYAFLFCLIAVTLEASDVKNILLRDKIFWLIGFVVTFAPIAHAFYNSLDMIKLTAATVYPGSRFVLGGDISPIYQMIYGISALLPFLDTITTGVTNNCEAATFFSAAPLGLLIFFYATFKRNRFDIFMTLLVVLSGLFILWETFGVPAWLAKITLMKTVTTDRAKVVVDFMQLLILIRGLNLIEINLSRVEKIFLAGAISILGILAACNFLGAWMGIKKIIAVIFFTFTAIYLFMSKLTNLRVGILIFMMLAMGATVNPLARGVDCVYKIPVGQKISEIARVDKSLWIVEDDDMRINSFPIMFGAPTINCVNVYPVFERWQKLDPTGKNFELYNRYAHISIMLTNGTTEFSPAIFGDHFNLNINPADLPKLDARYIFSRDADLEKFSTPQIKIKKIYEDAGSFIYSVNF